MRILIPLALALTISTTPAQASKFTDFCEWSWRSTKAVARDTWKGFKVVAKYAKEHRNEIRLAIEFFIAGATL